MSNAFIAADRPAPRLRRCACVPALAVPRRGAHEPLFRSLVVARHEQRSPAAHAAFASCTSCRSSGSRSTPAAYRAAARSYPSRQSIAGRLRLDQTWRTTTGASGSRSTRRSTRGLLDRLAGELGAEAARARRRPEAAVASSVSRDGDTIFVYSGSQADAAKAQAILEAELREEHRGEDEQDRALARRRRALGRRATGETWEEETLDRGIRPVGGARPVRLARARPELSRRSSRRRATSRSATPTSSSSARRAARMRRRSRRGSMARSKRAARSSLEARTHAWPDNPFAVFGGLAQ